MLRHIMEAMDVLDHPDASGQRVKDWLSQFEPSEITINRIEEQTGSTDFVRVVIPAAHKTGPTLGIRGRLGGVDVRPAAMGLVSDADGCIVALACAAKLAEMALWGDVLGGDVIVTTHVCPNASTVHHEPTPFMGSPVDMAVMNRMEVDHAMSAILSVDATKGNWVINQRGFAITPTVKEGYILRIDERLLESMTHVTGRTPVVLPISTQDITPYGNGLYHLNSIIQPATATSAPVVGVAMIAAVAVDGCATGSNQAVDLEMAARFCVEVAKSYTAGIWPMYDKDEFDMLTEMYGSMNHLLESKSKC